MGTNRFRVRVTKDHLVFAAAHFITIGRDYCERLHGHNWRVAVEVTGPLDENQYVFDFIALRDGIQKLVDKLDHHVLLPTKHPELQIQQNEREVEVTFRDRRWVFPQDECYLLPLKQTTAELIGQWLGEQLIGSLTATDKEHLETLTVDVEENFGQWASCTVEVRGERREVRG